MYVKLYLLVLYDYFLFFSNFKFLRKFNTSQSILMYLFSKRVFFSFSLKTMSILYFFQKKNLDNILFEGQYFFLLLLISQYIYISFLFLLFTLESQIFDLELVFEKTLVSFDWRVDVQTIATNITEVCYWHHSSSFKKICRIVFDFLYNN